ncbi:MAG: hypothetical protein GY855_14375 [candidate division Zixibacteria bacterium]|nr:hypothetical protein [candidate division Zixibacteria bacterium]
MNRNIFATDLHGHIRRYHKLFRIIEADRPESVFLGGDILPSGFANIASSDNLYDDFIKDFLAYHFAKLRQKLKDEYPRVFLILGNDDGRFDEKAIAKYTSRGLWEYMHNKAVVLKGYHIYGYSYVPPTPFLFKDWERYDVSRYVDPGSISPEEGHRSIKVPPNEIKFSTIKEDLDELAGNENLEKSVFLFHAPPYKTKLDRAALDGKFVDHVPLDPHVGSIAIKRFIENRQPLLTLHGHIHESTILTGSWQDRIGKTYSFNAAHHGPELCIIRFDFDDLDSAERELI